MSGGERAVSSAREATEALRRLVSRVEASGPGEIEERSAEALDELARLADLLGRTVEDVVRGDTTGDGAGRSGSGAADGDGREIQALADQLAAAIAGRHHARPR
jgi:hypothetical protein